MSKQVLLSLLLADVALVLGLVWFVARAVRRAREDAAYAERREALRHRTLPGQWSVREPQVVDERVA